MIFIGTPDRNRTWNACLSMFADGGISRQINDLDFRLSILNQPDPPKLVQNWFSATRLSHNLTMP